MITNHNFDSGNYEGWIITLADEANATVVKPEKVDEFHDGSDYLLISSDVSGESSIVQKVDVKPGSTYRLSYNYKYKKITDGNGLSHFFRVVRWYW